MWSVIFFKSSFHQRELRKSGGKWIFYLLPHISTLYHRLLYADKLGSRHQQLLHLLGDKTKPQNQPVQDISPSALVPKLYPALKKEYLDISIKKKKRETSQETQQYTHGAPFQAANKESSLKMEQPKVDWVCLATMLT